MSGASFRMSDRISLDAAAGYTDVESGPISRDERFYAGTAAQTDVLTDGRAHNPASDRPRPGRPDELLGTVSPAKAGIHEHGPSRPATPERAVPARSGMT